MNLNLSPCERTIMRIMRQASGPMTLATIITESEYSTANHVASCLRNLTLAGMITAATNPDAKSKQDRYVYTLGPIQVVAAAPRELALAG